MQRLTQTPRPDWPSRVEEVGLTYHTPDGVTYWDESASYRFSPAQIDVLEAAGNTLHAMCLEAVEHVLATRRFDEFGLSASAVGAIVDSWNRDDFSLYGRFDLAYDGIHPPRLLEYNADTPTALVEAAVAQWYWLREFGGLHDQFNSIHEKLIGAWKSFATAHSGPVWLGGLKGHLEDAQTVLYLQDTCHQAGLETRSLFVEDIGYDSARAAFVDFEGREISACFKLYPWEWMWSDEFSKHLPSTKTRFIEPLWKMLLSNKALLPVLWELFPGHPHLLPAYDDTPANRKRFGGEFVRKPKLSREGANVTFFRGDHRIEETGGDYGSEGFILQEAAQLPSFDGNYPICGVWIVAHEACGLGIREDSSRITGNGSRFIPHFF